MKIFKYCSININTLTCLLTSKNWYSRIKYLNDPFEMFFKDQTNSSIYEQFKEKLCICSFSKNRNEILMWSHYANNHEGVCLEFEINESKWKGALNEIVYDNNIQTISEVERYDTGYLKLNSETNGSFLTRKLKTWEYEEELRIINEEADLNKKGKLVNFPGKLSAIYFGKNSNTNNILLVKKTSEHFDDLNYYKVDIDPSTAKMDTVNRI